MTLVPSFSPRVQAPQGRRRFAAYATVWLMFRVLAVCPIAQAPFEIKWTNDRLSVRASHSPLATVIAEVSRLADIKIIGLENLTGSLTADLVDLRAEQALATMLTGVNYVLAQRPAPHGLSGTRLVLYVHSMADREPSLTTLDGPIYVPALSALVALDAAEEAAATDDDESEHPDTISENQQGTLEAAQLAAQGAFGPEATGQSLKDYLDDDNLGIRLEAVKALSTRPMTVALGPLTRALGDEAWAVRDAAVDVLGRARDLQSLNRIGQMLQQDPNRYVRIGALRILALRAEQESSTYLDSVVEDEDGLIRDAAKQMLGELARRRDRNTGTQQRRSPSPGNSVVAR